MELRELLKVKGKTWYEICLRDLQGINASLSDTNMQYEFPRNLLTEATADDWRDYLRMNDERLLTLDQQAKVGEKR